MAGVTGLEPATSGVTGRRSNQLSYTPAGAPSRGVAAIGAASCLRNERAGRSPADPLFRGS